MDRPIYGCLWLLLTDIPALRDPGPQSLPSGSQPFLPGTWKARLPRPSAAADAPVPLTLELGHQHSPSSGPAPGPPLAVQFILTSIPVFLLLPQEWKSKIHIETTGSFHFILILACPQTFLRGEPEPSGHSCFLRRML